MEKSLPFSKCCFIRHMGTRISQMEGDEAMGCIIRGVIPGTDKKFFSSPNMPRTALWPTQVFFPHRLKDQGKKLTTYLHLVQRL
jgi:hypothetical protein